MILMDGRKVSKEILLSLKADVDRMHFDHIHPKLVVILVGKDPASLAYINQKQKACDLIGIEWEQFDYEPDVTNETLIEKIEELNEDKTVHGILVQLPLPKHIYTPNVIRAINPKKDVDGLTAYNLGKTFINKDFEDLAPCTPLGVIKLLEYYKIPIQGQDITIVGHSNIAGKPLAMMLLNRDATVTVCHIHTKDLKAHTVKADILCVAVGKPNLITEDMVKEGAVVIDIGINRLKDSLEDFAKVPPASLSGPAWRGDPRVPASTLRSKFPSRLAFGTFAKSSLVGDIDFDPISKKVSYITPVPGGIGPMTVACLMLNTVKACKRLHNYESI